MRKLPPQNERVETGVVQFGNDWPGVFIRGDDCAGFYAGICLNPPESPFRDVAIRSLMELLHSSRCTPNGDRAVNP